MTITTPLRRPWIPRAWVTGLILLLAALLVMAAPSARAADQAPIRTITGGTTGLYYPYGVAVLADGALAVVNFVGNSVTVYAAGADGNVAPIRTIAGTNTGLNRPSGVAVLADGALAISNFANSNTSSVTVYAAGATGNVAPIRTIAGGTTGLIYPVGVAVLADGALAVSNRGTSSSSVTVYAAGADGNVAPIRTIAGGTTGLNTPGGVAVLADGALAVSNGGTPSVTVYAAGADGNVAPIRTIAGGTTGLNTPGSVAVLADGALAVGNYNGNSVTVYAAGADGNVAPIRTIAGSKTGLNYPIGVAVLADGALAVSNYVGNSVTVYAEPCGPGIPLTTSPTPLWLMLALPCVPNASPATVADVFGNSPTANLDASLYDNTSTGWVMYRREVNTTPSSYVKLTTDTALATGAGYWLKSLSAPVGGKLTVAGTATPPTTGITDCQSANGCAVVPVQTVTGSNRYNLVGNPFPYNVDWAKVRVRVGGSGGAVYTPSQAAGEATGEDAAGNANPPVMSKSIWIWNGNQYDTWSDVSTPNPGNLKYFQSFWINVLPGAAGQTVELLIPAEESTHAQVQPDTGARVAAAGRPWYLSWLDWLVAPALAAPPDDLHPGRAPEDTGRPVAPPGQAAHDPGFEALVIEYEQQGLSPQDARRAAHEQARREGREWYVQIKVDNPATGAKDHNTFLGQLLTAQDGYDPADLIEMAPFAQPYLTMVFPHPEWGDRKGDYASDFRTAFALKPGDWNFEVRAEPVGSTVVLSWVGDPKVLKRSRLLDLDTGATIRPDDKRYANGYSFTLTSPVRRFAWRHLGR